MSCRHSLLSPCHGDLCPLTSHRACFPACVPPQAGGHFESSLTPWIRVINQIWALVLRPLYPNSPCPFNSPYLPGTRFGAMLDMLTDRCSTMCLLVNLALLYPRATLFFQLSMSLDVASHWLHLHSSVVRGSESHKMIDLSGNPVLRIYYTSRPVLFTLCAGNELFYCLLYLLHFSEGPLVGSVGLFRMGLWVTAPIALLKSLISLVHLVTAARNMAALDAADRAKKK
uniref:CDP-diacylglycerol--inositol 3-phosphatidyltransferase n=2 Tax=Cebus imitator TaxID=2715852 RepID=A0A2K5R5X8_CEBIM